MKLSKTAEALTLVVDALDKVIIPELLSLDAKETANTVQQTLKDLLKRQGPSRRLLRTTITDGLALELEINSFLGRNKYQGTEDLYAKDFDQLSEYYEALMRRLAKLSTELRTLDSINTPDLLRRAADWEYSYYAKIPQTQEESYYQKQQTSRSTEHLLTKTALEEILIEKRGTSDLEVTHFERLHGGHGKQTYLARVKTANEDQEIVIRREDANPIIHHGMFEVPQEYSLLKSLSKTGFPCPVPYELSTRDRFYTMNRVPGKIVTTYLGSTGEELSEGMVLQMAEILAKLHSYPLEAFSDYFEAAGANAKDISTSTTETLYRANLKEWEQYLGEVEHLPSTYMTWIFDWLSRNVPKDDRRPVLTHGDYSVHNMLQIDGHITGILDWECADFAAPEQDLVYVQPTVEKSTVSWERFLDHYASSGGLSVNKSMFAFCHAYAIMKVMLAFNRATLNLQTGAIQDIRLLMVEYGYQASFMGLGLQATLSEPENFTEIVKTTDPTPSVHEASTSIITYDDTANVRQASPPKPNWQESVVLVWYDEENGVGGFHRLGHEPNNPDGGIAVLWTNLVGPTGIFKRVQTQPLRPADLIEGGGFGSGDERCTVEFKDGAHIWTINEPEDEITAHLEHRDTGPTIDCFPKRGAIGEGFAAAHFDIPRNLTGTVSVKGKLYTIKNGLSLRDHAWGVRDWGSAGLSHRWVIGTCGSEFSFVCVSWHGVSDQFSDFAWVVRDGKVTVALAVDITAYMSVDSCTNRGGSVALELTTGEKFNIVCTPVANATVCWHRGMACVDRLCNFKAYRAGPERVYNGFANFETSSNVQHGTRKPGKLIGGVIEDGFTPL